MGERRINYYEFPHSEPDWKEFKKSFKLNTSKHNVPFFEDGSESEQRFFRFCESARIEIQKKTIVEYEGEGGGGGNYLYLTLKDDDGMCIKEENSEFIDRSNACQGGGAFGICCYGAKQVGNVAVNFQGLNQLDRLGLIVARYPFVPKIYLLSRRLAQIIIDAKLTGCEVVPCEIVPKSSASSNSLACYQLRITTQTTGTAKVGRAQIGKRCPNCGVAKFFLSTEERHFFSGDLNSDDFQICRAYEATNVGRFEIAAGFPIISRRAFDLLSNHKTDGLNRYSTDPPIQTAVVQVR